MRLFGVLRKLASLLLGMAVLFVLGGCGREGHTATANPPGVFIDNTTEQFLRKAFDETKSCAQLDQGKYEDTTVILMPPVFPCQYYPDGCSGEYISPNSFKIGTLSMWRHEVLHYLLEQKTGDPDLNHTSPFFKQCT